MWTIILLLLAGFAAGVFLILPFHLKLLALLATEIERENEDKQWAAIMAPSRDPARSSRRQPGQGSDRVVALFPLSGRIRASRSTSPEFKA